MLEYPHCFNYLCSRLNKIRHSDVVAETNVFSFTSRLLWIYFQFIRWHIHRSLGFSFSTELWFKWLNFKIMKTKNWIPAKFKIDTAFKWKRDEINITRCSKNRIVHQPMKIIISLRIINSIVEWICLIFEINCYQSRLHAKWLEIHSKIDEYTIQHTHVDLWKEIGIGWMTKFLRLHNLFCDTWTNTLNKSDLCAIHSSTQAK